METLSIISLNCQGLGEQRKRRDVFHYLRQKQHCIYLLQDTHFDSKIERYVRAEWGYNCHFASKNSQSRGVAILFNNNFEYKIKKVYKDPDGNYIFASFSSMGKDFLLISVYGPNRDDPEFYNEIEQYIKEVGFSHLIIAGDWNLVLDSNLDYHNYKHDNNVKARERVEDMIINLDLTDIWRDLNPDTRRYTWRRTTPLQQSRLDFFLVSDTLVQFVEDADIKYGYRSDHSMIVLKMSFGTEIKRNTFWKMNNLLLKDKDYLSLVNEEIRAVVEEYAVPIYNRDMLQYIPKSEIQLTISDQLFLEMLLMKIRTKTIAYASSKKRQETMREKQLEIDIQLLEKKLDKDNDDNDKLDECKKELLEIRDKKIEGVLLRSRARWIAEGEKVSKYFCSLEKRHFVSKCMKKLVTNQGKEIYEHEHIKNEVKTFYESLYEKRQVEDCEIERLVTTLPTLTNEQSTEIEGSITLEEASCALKNMKNNKSPGSDGFTSEFFKVFWIGLGVFVVRALNDGYEKGELSSTQKEGVIVCIPKGDKPREFVKNWRPISLLNVIYKIGSACITNRMKKVLPCLINYDQSGFLSNRYMGDNIRLIYDIMHYLNYKNLPGLLLCIDFEKAFDSVAWSFLHKVLKAFCFGPSICRWIETFLCNIKSTVIVNGTVSPWFPIKRGCRQGDPISPYLFILCVEIMAIMIRENDRIKGVTINNIEHKIAQFADDTQMLSEGDTVSFEQTVHTVDLFGHKSGLYMNSTKTQAIWLGSRKDSPVRYLPHLEMDWNPSKFKILGIWLTADLTNCETINYDDKFSEIKLLFRAWLKRQITPLGRIAILKSLILSKLVHLWMLLPNPPDDFTSGLQKMCFKFVWNKKQDRISRATAVKSVAKGGLGLTDLSHFANSLKLTWIRKLKNNTHKWTSVISLLIPTISSLDLYGSDFPLNKDRVNTFWIHTLKAYSIFCKKVSLSKTDEVVAEPLFYNENIKVGNKTLLHREWVEHGVTHICHLLQRNGTFMSQDDFNIKYGLHANFLCYNGCIQAVKKYMRVNGFAIQNNAAKTQRKALDIIYSVTKGTKTYYEVYTENSHIPNCCEKWNNKFAANLNWKPIFAQIKKIKEIKLKWFQMRIVHRIIGTNKSLKWMNIVNSDSCAFCDEMPESIQHLFWGCEIVHTFWTKLEQHMNMRCDHMNNVRFNEHVILFGYANFFISDDVFDFIILFAKFYVYKCKLANARPVLSVFIKQLHMRYEIEKYLSVIHMEYHTFRNSWCLYLPIFDNHT